MFSLQGRCLGITVGCITVACTMFSLQGRCLGITVGCITVACTMFSLQGRCLGITVGCIIGMAPLLWFGKPDSAADD